jgi:hypothetical protein
MSVCTERCWTAVVCPDHGTRMNPFGRSAPDGTNCCENYSVSKLNPRHLWDEHDSTRWYTDPDGWGKHEAGCAICKGENE